MNILFNLAEAECILPVKNPHALTEPHFKDAQDFQAYLISVKEEQQDDDCNHND